MGLTIDYFWRLFGFGLGFLTVHYLRKGLVVGGELSWLPLSGVTLFGISFTNMLWLPIGALVFFGIVLKLVNLAFAPTKKVSYISSEVWKSYLLAFVWTLPFLLVPKNPIIKIELVMKNILVEWGPVIERIVFILKWAIGIVVFSTLADPILNRWGNYKHGKLGKAIYGGTWDQETGEELKELLIAYRQAIGDKAYGHARDIENEIYVTMGLSWLERMIHAFLPFTIPSGGGSSAKGYHLFLSEREHGRVNRSIARAQKGEEGWTGELVYKSPSKENKISGWQSGSIQRQEKARKASGHLLEHGLGNVQFDLPTQIGGQVNLFEKSLNTNIVVIDNDGRAPPSLWYAHTLLSWIYFALSRIARLVPLHFASSLSERLLAKSMRLAKWQIAHLGARRNTIYISGYFFDRLVDKELALLILREAYILAAKQAAGSWTKSLAREVTYEADIVEGGIEIILGLKTPDEENLLDRQIKQIIERIALDSHAERGNQSDHIADSHSHAPRGSEQKMRQHLDPERLAQEALERMM